MARKKGKEMDTKGALIDAAWGLFQAQGFEATSVDAIAARAGLSKGTFFHYFESKRNLLEDVCRRMVTIAHAELAPLQSEPNLSPVERLNRLIFSTRHWQMKHIGTLVDLWQASAHGENKALWARFATLSDEEVFPYLVSIVRDGSAQGVFDVQDPEETSRLILALLERGARESLARYAEKKASEETVCEALRWNNALMSSVERVIGAPSGSIVRIEARAFRRRLRERAAGRDEFNDSIVALASGVRTGSQMGPLLPE